MKSFTCILLLVLVQYSFSSAQPVDTLWSRTFGGPRDDTFYALEHTSDGGFICAGYTRSFGQGDNDFYLVKTDAEGNQIWTNTYGGTAFDGPWTVHQLPDGGYMLVGNTLSFSRNGDWECALVRTDADGNQLFLRTYGGDGGDNFHDGKPTPDGGFIMTGIYERESGYDFYLVKTDSMGSLEWENFYGGDNAERGRAVVLAPDGGYAMAGNTESFDNPEKSCYLVKTDSTGSYQWGRVYGGTSYDEAYDLVNTGDGGFLLGGCTFSFGAGGLDIYLVRTDSLGDTLWTRTYGGAGDEFLYALKNSLDGGYLIAGDHREFESGNTNPLAMKLDSAGNVEWTWSIDLPFSDSGLDICEIENGEYMVCGQTASAGSGGLDGAIWRISLSDSSLHHFHPVDPTTNSYTVQIDSASIDGKLLARGDEIGIFDEGICVGAGRYFGWPLTITTWQADPEMNRPGFTSNHPIFYAVWSPLMGQSLHAIPSYVTGNGNFGDGGQSEVSLTAVSRVAIHTPSQFGLSDRKVTAGVGKTASLTAGLPMKFSVSEAYPNPFNPLTQLDFAIPEAGKVAIRVFNVLGQQVEHVEQEFAAGQHRFVFDSKFEGQTLVNGLYVLQLDYAGQTLTRKAILLK